MSAFELYHKQGIRQYRVTDISRKKDHKIVIRGIRRTDSLQCPVCGSKNVSTKGWKERVFIGVPSGNPTVTSCEIHGGETGVAVVRGGRGTFNNNTLKENSYMDWFIMVDPKDVKGRGNTPEFPYFEILAR